MADGELGYGTKYQTGDGSSPEAFTDTAFVTSITPPGMSRDSIDVSHMQSPDAWREFIAGMKDGGEVSLELNFRPGGSAFLAMLAEFNLASASATKTRRIVWPDTSSMEFEAFLTGFEPETPMDDKQAASATFKVSGRPYLTQAA
jgi:predicted secreted protein